MTGEIRIKTKNFIIVLILTVFLLYVISGKRKCEPDVVIEDDSLVDLPTIYTITPTYARPVQKAELTR